MRRCRRRWSAVSRIGSPTTRKCMWPVGSHPNRGSVGIATDRTVSPGRWPAVSVRPAPPQPARPPARPPGAGSATTAEVSPAPALPPSLTALLTEFRSCFTAWTFPVFCALAAGLLAQTGRRTVCGMLVGARLSRVWSHHRAHRFFSHARWSLDQVSATLTRLVVRLLVPEGQPVTVAVDDTLFHRRGPKVHAASWFHDGSAQGTKKVGYGNNWVIAAIIVQLPFLDRPVALPAGFALVVKGTNAASRLESSRRLVESLAAAVPDRRVHVVADCAYAGKALRGLDSRISWTTRLRSNAALYQLTPPRPGPATAPPPPCTPPFRHGRWYAVSARSRSRSCSSATVPPPATTSR